MGKPILPETIREDIKDLFRQVTKKWSINGPKSLNVVFVKHRGQVPVKQTQEVFNVGGGSVHNKFLIYQGFWLKWGLIFGLYRPFCGQKER